MTNFNEFQSLILFNFFWLYYYYYFLIFLYINILTENITLVVVQLLSHVQPFATPWTVAHHASLSFTISQSLLKLMSFELVMPSNHLILCCPFSWLQSFPTSGSFPMRQLFTSGGQSIFRFSTSPFNEYPRASLGAQTVKHLSAMQETRVWSLVWEDPLEKEMAAESSILAWKNPMDGGAW